MSEFIINFRSYYDYHYWIWVQTVEL